MRRKDREITNIESIINIIESCKVFRVAMSVQDMPYIVPLNFGYSYKNDIFEFYFHSAMEGKKLDIIKINPLVCFEMDCNHELTRAELVCSYGYNYKSIIGNGKVQIVDNIEEKILYLKNLMKHQTGNEFEFTNQQVTNVAVCKITVTEISAKKRMS